jgi:O-acetyl-ADP-ribose deacetylase (regulator of RNase III)
MITHVVGDLLESDEFIIAHGCNTQGFMGAGIAKAVAEKYPQVYESYKWSCHYGHFRVGGLDVHHVLEGESTARFVLNLGTQEFTGANASYWALTLAMGNAFEWARKFGHKRIAIPRIGCGIGGLEWKTVEWVIDGIYQWVPSGPEVVVYTHPKEVHKWTT